MNEIRKIYIITALLTLLTAGCAKQSDLNKANPTGDSYIVVLKKENVAAASAKLSATSVAGSLASISANAALKTTVVANLLSSMSSDHRIAQADIVFTHSIQGGLYHLSADEAEELSQDPNVAFLEKDQVISINNVTQSNPTWGLDRIDQAALPLSKSYSYANSSSGAGVNVYVIDTGIRVTHEQFAGRAFSAVDLVDNDNNADDCNGHGTHVAGTIGSNTYGVAKNAKLFAVRVLNCEGSGTISGVIAGIEWVTAHHVSPAVANMSLGGGASQALDQAIQASIQSGVTYAVAAGNDNVGACNSSPARVPEAITVGSTTSSDDRSDFSNYGTCVSLFAPGSDITSTWNTSDTATNKISGTSMATPHVTGAAALYLSSHPSATPAQVKSALLAAAVSGKVGSPGSGSPNLLLNTQFLMEAPAPTPSPVPTPAPVPAPTPAPAPADPGSLVNGATRSNLSAAKNGDQNFNIDVPANSASLLLSISGGSGDADIYVKFGSQPTSSSYDCRPYKSGNNESCNFASPKAGKWYVTVKAYAAYSGLNLSARYKTK